MEHYDGLITKEEVIARKGVPDEIVRFDEFVARVSDEPERVVNPSSGLVSHSPRAYVMARMGGAPSEDLDPCWAKDCARSVLLLYDETGRFTKSGLGPFKLYIFWLDDKQRWSRTSIIRAWNPRWLRPATRPATGPP